MDIGSCCRSRKNVGQWLRLMSVWALSLWPLRIWQEQSQAGVTASIHLLVSCNREGAFVQGHTRTNTHASKHIHTLKPVFSTHFSKQGCTHISVTHTRAPVSEVCTHSFRHTHTYTLTQGKKKPSWQAPLCVFPGRSRFAMLTSFKCLRALMSYYGRQTTCRANTTSLLVSSGHDNRRNMFHLSVSSFIGWTWEILRQLTCWDS